MLKIALNEVILKDSGRRLTSGRKKLITEIEIYRPDLLNGRDGIFIFHFGHEDGTDGGAV
mgnify:CR=1 FL=1